MLPLRFPDDAPFVVTCLACRQTHDVRYVCPGHRTGLHASASLVACGGQWWNELWADCLIAATLGRVGRLYDEHCLDCSITGPRWDALETPVSRAYLQRDLAALLDALTVFEAGIAALLHAEPCRDSGMPQSALESAA